MPYTTQEGLDYLQELTASLKTIEDYAQRISSDDYATAVDGYGKVTGTGDKVTKFHETFDAGCSIPGGTETLSQSGKESTLAAIKEFSTAYKKLLATLTSKASACDPKLLPRVGGYISSPLANLETVLDYINTSYQGSIPSDAAKVKADLGDLQSLTRQTMKSWGSH